MNNPADQRRRRLIQLGGLVAAAAVVVLVAILVSQGGSDDGDDSAGSPEQIEQSAAELERYDGLVQSGISLGDPNARAVMHEFVDMQCPFCAEYSRDALPAVIDRYVREGRLRLELNVLTFLGEDSEEAGSFAAAAALQNRLWQFSELFFLNQGRENSGYVTEAFLREIGSQVPGLDVDLAFEQRDSPEAANILNEARQNAERLGVESTPSLLLAEEGGEPQPLALSELSAAAVTTAIDEALGEP